MIESTPRAAALKVLVAAGAMLLVLVGTEMVLRLIKYGDEFPDAKPPAYERAYDPQRGFYLKPHQTIDWNSPCFDVRGIKTNSFGMRDRERQVAKTGPRAALLGDSFLRSFEVNNEDVVNVVLEKEFKNNVEFLNFGESGYGTIQVRQTYVKFVSQFKPDVVLYFMFPNDVIDNHFMLRAWRQGVAGEAGRGFDQYPDMVKNNDGSWEFLDAIEQKDAYAIRRRLKRRFKIYLMASYAKHQLEPHFDKIKSKIKPGAPAQNFFPAAQNVPYGQGEIHNALYSDPRNQYWEEAWAITEYAMADLAKAARRDGAQFILVGIPEKIIYKTREPDPNYDPQYFFKKIGSLTKKHSIPFLNLQEMYPRYAPNPLSLYHECNIHWNEEGQRVTAAAVAAFLRRRKYF